MKLFIQQRISFGGILPLCPCRLELHNSVLLSLLLIITLLFQSCKQQPVLTSFPTGGHTVYHLKPATVSKNGKRVVISAAYDGYVLCHTRQGKLLWKTQPGKGFPFDLEVYDIDNDGLDESMVASSDGSLYVLDHEGKLKWTFGGHPLPPLYQVAVENDSSGKLTILTGGIERILYTLSTDGKVLSKKEGKEVIRFIGNEAPVIRHKCTDMILRPYNMDFITHVKSSTLNDEYMLNLSGRNLIVYNLDGSCRKVLRAPLSFTGTAFDDQNNTFWLGSEISGGDGIYGVRLDKSGWEEAFVAIKPVGKMAQIEENMALLLKQAETFQTPSYQKEPQKTMIVIEESADWDYKQMLQNLKTRYIEPYKIKNINFVPFVYSHENVNHFKEYYDPGLTNPRFKADWEKWHAGTGGGKIGDVIGKNLPKEEILQFAKDREQAGEDFFIYGGHGRMFGLDFYLSPETLAELLRIAPNTLKGFNFAELEYVDEPLKTAIRKQLIPLADHCYEHGKKIIFLRNKNIFWNGNIYLDMFKPVMSEGKYSEIFVPNMEETNSRSQSLSLAGRTGLWLVGKFSHMSGRGTTDNPNYNRLWHWCQTENLSLFVRVMSLQRMLGADMFMINILTDNSEQLLPFYLMIEKGILPLPTRNDIVSLSDMTVGMKSPDMDFIRHGTNGHRMNLYSADEGQFVFDRLDCYWGGAMIPEHDFENYAMNAKRRMTNFIAQSPYGNMTMIPAETDISEFPFFRKMFVTDGRYWYDEAGNTHSAEEYKPVILKALEESAQRLPIRIFGDVSWAAVRLDPTHIRLVLIDPGYLDPADREAVIVFQHINPVEVKDILSGEIITANEQGDFKVNIPMGILRVIDIEHK